MADSKISALTAQSAADVVAGDLFVTVDVSDTTMSADGTNEKITAGNAAIALERLAAVRSTFSDADYTIQTTDRYVASITTLTSLRTLTLPAASAFPTGVPLVISDEERTIGTGLAFITVTRAGSDTFQDGSTSINMQERGEVLVLYSDGAAEWTVGPSSVGFSRTIVGTWKQDNVTAAQSGVALTLVGDAARTEIPVSRAGYLSGIVIRSNEARTAGSCTVDATINGTATGALTGVLNASNTQTNTGVATVAAGFNVAAGDRIGVKVTTTAGWTPTTADIIVTVEYTTLR